jgi:hypothetical protein
MYTIAMTALQLRVLTLAILVGVLALGVCICVFVIRRMRSSQPRSHWEALLERSVERVGPIDEDAPMVSFTFHTYSGLLVFFTQQEHRPELPLPVAVEYLRELHRFNLIRCLVPYPGMLFVPILSIINYRAQLQSIRRQGAAALSTVDSD